MESRQYREGSMSPRSKASSLRSFLADDQRAIVANSKSRPDRRREKEHKERHLAPSSPQQQQQQQCRATALQIPQTLVPLVPWTVKQDVQLLSGIGAASQCPVLVASLSVPRVSDLPEFPSLQHVDDELLYKSVVPQPSSSQAVASKKYHHPALMRADACKGWVCKHTANHVRIISPGGIVLHSATVVRRTSSAVRREILELEMLMQGLVMEGSTCAMVRFQDEINRIRAMANEMVDSSGCRATSSPAAEPDYTGLRQFYREYDTALAALWARRAECVSELAKLEDCNLQLDTTVTNT